MRFDVVVVGAGFSGSVMARRFAEEYHKKVLVIEKHDHIAGHAHDRLDQYGVLVHAYGPHIFHTNEVAVWDWLSRFTDWHHYQHRVLSYVDGQLVPMPISNDTINMLFGESLNTDGTEAWLKERSIPVEKIENSRDVVLSQAGKEIYEKFFRNYTYKQWGIYPEDLSPDVIKRVPIRTSRDTRYFTDAYQGLPKQGYTEMFRQILSHPSIHLMLNTDWFDVKDDIASDFVVYTGPVDAYFNYKYGRLDYRSVRFEYETFFDRERYQPVGTVNYPNDYAFTRITEYKHLTGQRIPITTIAREYSSSVGEPFYPVPTADNIRKAAQYAEDAKQVNNTLFIGRLAEYSYYNMDRVVSKALNTSLGKYV